MQMMRMTSIIKCFWDPGVFKHKGVNDIVEASKAQDGDKTGILHKKVKAAMGSGVIVPRLRHICRVAPHKRAINKCLFPAQ